MPTPVPSDPFQRNPVPARAGIGLRSDHYQAIEETRPDVAFLEVHSENYFGRGGVPHRYLQLLRADYALSLHGVGLSLGTTDTLDRDHLQRLKELIARYQPGLVSEHLSWSSVGGTYMNDLLPLPYTDEAMSHVVDRINEVQDFLRRQILIENVSSYFEYNDSDIPEWEFLAGVAERSGCGILLDCNNLYVNSRNHGFDTSLYIRSIPLHLVQEIHLAGYTVNTFEDGQLLIDTHNQLVSKPVWALYRDAVRRFGAVPTLVEWDTDLPELPVLLQEAMRAQTILDEETRARVA